MKILMSIIAVLLVSVVSQAREVIDYSCDEGQGTVSVAFENNKAVALYTDVMPKDVDEVTYEKQARNAVLIFDLRVSKYKNGIIFTIETDEHEGETQDIRCKRI